MSTVGPFPGAKTRPGLDADHSPHLVSKLWMSRSYISSSLCISMGVLRQLFALITGSTWKYKSIKILWLKKVNLRRSCMAQVVSRLPYIPEARVRAWVCPCGICGGQSDTVIVFSQSSSVFPSQYHFTVFPFSYITWKMNNRPVGGSSSET
jgi:hypothetical protein